MKNTLAFLLVIAALALGVLCVAQRREINEEKTQAAGLRTDLEEKSQQIEKLQENKETLMRERDELRRKTDELAVQAHEAKAAAQAAHATAPPAKTVAANEGEHSDKDEGGFGKMLSKMMSDPEMKKMIQGQQRQMMDRLYGPLAKQMGLTPEEASKLKDLIADSQMSGMAQAGTLFDGSSSNRQEQLATITQAQKESDEQIKQLLGDARYALYKDYQMTVGERMALDQFKLTTGGEQSVSDDQTERLLGIMKEAKQNLAATGQPVPGGDQGQANIEAMLSPDAMEKMLSSQETMNQQVYERAKEVLSVEQLQSFGQFQTNQLQMMRMGASMAKKFFVPEKTGGN